MRRDVSAILCFALALAQGVPALAKATADVRETQRLAKELAHECSASLSNGKASWWLSFRNVRAHGTKPRRFALLVDNRSGHNQSFTGKRESHGVCGLIEGIGLTVNGIPWTRLQMTSGSVRRFAERDAVGVEAYFNFDGAKVRFRSWQDDKSPLLRFEVSPLAETLRPVTNVSVRVSAIPSFLDYGGGKPTRFKGYRRQVWSDRRRYPPRRGERIALAGDETAFALEDEEFDGSADGKGLGPTGVILEKPCKGAISLNEWWTTELHFTPDPKGPFRFSILEFQTVRTSNADFEKALVGFMKP